MDKKIIGGVFSNIQDAEEAIKGLKDEGFGSEDITVFAKDKDQVNEIEDETDTDVSKNKTGRGKNSGIGAGYGAASGGVLGGIAGWIAGIGLLTIPGIGAIAAAGPLATTLSGAGVGAGSGGIVGALVGAGIPEEQAKQYESDLKDGKIIVFVEAPENKQSAVYHNFLESRTENSSMYPEGVGTGSNQYNHR
ncbi:Heat induced stress protein YflT [Thalassobacillus cyri]|uniref:Heat induced stress protein YflT n=1 Tax=Thalassobacillus cyri TaxID=571932 RepID=A0A1H3W0M2_9BACI|nr:general stress protein [Thalassobacillus cyri]SDZ80685.1 Heat induced stress protein YflT [Thalassobacillus cyri]